MLDGLRLDMEMQMVFYDKRNNDITTAIAKDKQVTVVSVLFKVSNVLMVLMMMMMMMMMVMMMMTMMMIKILQMDPTDNPELRDMLAALQVTMQCYCSESVP